MPERINCVLKYDEAIITITEGKKGKPSKYFLTILIQILNVRIFNCLRLKIFYTTFLKIFFSAGFLAVRLTD